MIFFREEHFDEGNMLKKINWLLILILVTASGAYAQDQRLFDRPTIHQRMLKVVEWQLAHPNHELYRGTTRVFAGIFAAYERLRHRVDEGHDGHGREESVEPGPRFDHADDIAIGQRTSLYRIRKDRKMIQRLMDTVARIQTEKGDQVAKHGITWWWCDALFMGPPTLAKLARTTGDKSYLALNDKLFRETLRSPL